MDLRDVIIASIGLILGVLFEDPLTRLRDTIIHRYKKLFYKRPDRISTSQLFSFGHLKTSWMIIDGDGESEYLPETVITHFDNAPLELPEDLEKRKKEVQKQEVAKVNKRVEEIVEYRTRGVKDKWESSEFNTIKFELHTVLKFVFSNEPWAPGALANIYHVLVHEFGREKTDKAITAYKV